MSHAVSSEGVEALRSVELVHVRLPPRLAEKPFTCCTTGVGTLPGRRSKERLVFLGREDGKVVGLRMTAGQHSRHYDEVEHAQSAGEEGMQLDKPRFDLFLEEKSISVSKKPVVQLELDSGNERLFALVDGQVSGYAWETGAKSVVDLKQKFHLPGLDGAALTGAQCFCIASDRQQGQSNVCVCTKRKVHLFTCTGASCAEYLGTSDPAQLAELLKAWASEGFVSCAWHGSYLTLMTQGDCRVINLDTCRVVHREEDRERKKFNPFALPLPDRACYVDTYETDELEAGEVGYRCDVLLQMGLHSYLVTESGDREISPLVERSLSEVRLAALCGSQYLLVVTADGLHAVSLLENLDSDTRVPSDPAFARQVLGACGGGQHAFFCTPKELYAVCVVPYQDQVLQLARRGGGAKEAVEFAEFLLRHTYPHGLRRKEGVEAGLDKWLAFMYTEAAWANFKSKHFDVAFEFFYLSWKADPQFFDVREILEPFVAERIVSYIGPGSGYVRPDQYRPTVRDKARAAANASFYKYLKQVRVLRPAFEAAAALEGQEEQHEEELNVAVCKARAVDTALLFTFLELYDCGPEADEEIRFVMCDGNWLEYNACCEEVLAKGRYRCLALLMLHDGNIEDALKVLKSLGTKGGQYQEEGQNGVKEAVLALHHCRGSAEDNKRVLDNLGWILEVDPDEAINALLVVRNPPLDHAEVLKKIEELPDDLVLKYLRHSVYDEGNTDPECHTQLALMLVRAVLVLLPLTRVGDTPLGIRPGEEAGLLGSMRQELKRFLEESTKYREAEVLAELYDTQLYPELVAVYSHTGEHDAALRVLLYEMCDPDAAQAYCEQQYLLAQARHVKRHLRKGADEEGNPEPLCTEELFGAHGMPEGDDRGNVFVGVGRHNSYLLDLVNLCLHPDRGEVQDRQPKLQLALELLQRHGSSLDAQQVLRLLPAHMLSVEQLVPYLRAVFHRHAALSHQEQIRVQLAKANRDKHKTDLGIMHRRSVVVDQDRTCINCGKRIGENAVVSVYPNLHVSHYRCVKEKEKDPVSQKAYWVDVDAVHPREKYNM
eukprot:Hpha_TRINITY_DN14922_c0_g1::TRINITY_DN14922_c0_g1_i1::g.144286::m.144286/K20183/VPS39, VAM6; Vam6/Vps39-like protein vacuolar protein sorting-associated protein 39